MSQPSLSGMGGREGGDREDPTPPISPFIGSEGTSGTAKAKIYTQKSASSRKYQDSSLDADDTESELVAIPESDLSESTLHNSVPGSFDDGAHFDEMAQPLKDQGKGKMGDQMKAMGDQMKATIGVAEHSDEKPEKPETKKTSRLFMKLNSLDKSGQKHSSLDSSKITTKCSVQEGVRMMVSPSIFMTQKAEAAVINHPVNVQRAFVVTQDNKANKDTEPKSETKDISEVDNSKSAIGSLLTEASTSVAKQIAMVSVKSSMLKFKIISLQFRIKK